MYINDVQFNADLEEILNEMVAQMRLNGINYIQKMKSGPENIQICCPYHKNGMEQRPSAGVQKRTGVFHCFTCGETHSLPELISFCMGYPDDFVGAFGWDWLLKNFASVQIESRKDIELDLERGHKASEEITYVTEEELDKYRYYHPYWTKRKIIDESLIELFDLGFDPATNCITFPVRDASGRCLFVARRNVSTKWFNYPQGVEKPVYGLYEFNLMKSRSDDKDKYNDVIICESMIDALTAWQYGRPAVALNGLGNERQFKELSGMDCRRFILATDADEAGMKARYRIRRNVRNKLIMEYRWDKEEAKDINDMTEEYFSSLVPVF